MYHDIESIYDNYFKGKLKKANKDSLLINKQIDNWIGKLKNGSCWLNYLNDNIRKEQYKILFHSLRLSLRSRALLLSFQSNFPDVDLDSREFQISKANTDIYDIVDKKINEIKNNYSALWYDNNISQHFKDLINGFEAQLSELRKKQKTTVNLSILDLVELIELCIWNAGSNPRAGFMNSWDWAFNSSDNDKIAAFNAFWNGLGVSGKRYNLIESILYWSGMDSQFRYVLKEFERSKHNNNIHFCNITMEHIFPQTPKKDFIFKEWGFRDEEEYEGFKNKSYNLALLEGGSPQAQAGNQPIIVIKSNVYKTQNLVKSTKKLGDILGEVAIRMKNNISPLYRTRLELRSIELALFAIERF